MRIVNMFALVALLSFAACGDVEPEATTGDSGVVGGDTSVTPSETPQDDAGSVVSSDAGVEPVSAD